MKWHSQSQNSFLSYFKSTPLQDISERPHYKDGLDYTTALHFYGACVERLGGTHGVSRPFLHDLLTEEDNVWEIILNVLSIMRKKRYDDEDLLRAKRRQHEKADKEEKVRQTEWNARVDAEARRQLHEEKSVDEMVRFHNDVAARKAELRATFT